MRPPENPEPQAQSSIDCTVQGAASFVEKRPGALHRLLGRRKSDCWAAQTMRQQRQ